MPPLIDLLPRRHSAPDAPEPSMLPRPECGKCGCRIPLINVRAETRSKGGTWYHQIQHRCEFCHVNFTAIFKFIGGAWTFKTTRMESDSDRLTRLGRRKRRRAA